MKSVIISLAVICGVYCWSTPPVALGPFMFTIPVVGIHEDSLPALEVAFHQVLGDENYLQLAVKEGELHFYGGAGGGKALLSLMKVTEAVNQAGFEIDPTAWRLKPQMLGISLSSKGGVKTTEVIAALKSIEEVSIKDSLLIGETTYHVIHLGRAIRYSDLIASIGEFELELDDLLWGHWKYGWEIEEDGHGHDMGMTLIGKTESK